MKSFLLMCIFIIAVAIQCESIIENIKENTTMSKKRNFISIFSVTLPISFMNSLWIKYAFMFYCTIMLLVCFYCYNLMKNNDNYNNAEVLSKQKEMVVVMLFLAVILLFLFII